MRKLLLFSALWMVSLWLVNHTNQTVWAVYFESNALTAAFGFIAGYIARRPAVDLANAKDETCQ